MDFLCWLVPGPFLLVLFLFLAVRRVGESIDEELTEEMFVGRVMSDVEMRPSMDASPRKPTADAEGVMKVARGLDDAWRRALDTRSVEPVRGLVSDDLLARLEAEVVRPRPDQVGWLDSGIPAQGRKTVISISSPGTHQGRTAYAVRIGQGIGLPSDAGMRVRLTDETWTFAKGGHSGCCRTCGAPGHPGVCTYCGHTVPHGDWVAVGYQRNDVDGAA